MHQSETGHDEAAGSDGEREADDSGTPSAVSEKFESAHRFMAWLRTGLADGSIRFNEARAAVHFVKEGMLLVSPRIFRDYAKSQRKNFDAAVGAEASDSDGARWIQRKVLRARWHVRGIDGENFTRYRWLRGAQGAASLSGLLIPDPQRFVSPLPPANPLLTPFPPENEPKP
jgi:hypothetical protein